MTTKQTVIETIQAMPDDVTLCDIADEIRILVALQRAREDIEAGRVISHEEAMKVFDRWLAPTK